MTQADGVRPRHAGDEEPRPHAGTSETGGRFFTCQVTR